MIRLHNSMSRQLELFQPQNEQLVTMYACGSTVYSSPHIGNARSAVVFDSLFRLLRHDYPAVNYVRNFTDVDDKIIQASQQRGVPINEITSSAIQGYLDDMSALGVLEPTLQPRATQHIEEIILMIQQLVDRGHAYVAEQEVLFHVPSNPHKGLAGHAENATRDGARVAVLDHKRDPRDFVLWKPARPDEPSWGSPWGNGRPGWHIECSAMIRATLGVTIDIHCGGADLRFPHHEAECSQSHCANDAPLARYWLHNGLLTINGHKMSKSLGNTLYMRDLLREYPGESIRLMLLQTQYRSDLDWTKEGMQQAHGMMTQLYRVLLNHPQVDATPSEPDPSVAIALRNDLNTSLALHELYGLANRVTESHAHWQIPQLVASANLLGLMHQSADQWFRSGINTVEIDRLIELRNSARANKDWALADQLRDQLKQMNVVVEDGNKGTVWFKEQNKADCTDQCG